MLAAFNRGADGSGFTADDERLMRTFAATAANAVVMARSVEAGRLRSAIAAADAERARWARELHDLTLQSVTLADYVRTAHAARVCRLRPVPARSPLHRGGCTPVSTRAAALNVLTHDESGRPATAAMRRRVGTLDVAGLAWGALVLVPSAEPRPRLVAPLRRPVEPLVHAPQSVQTTRVGRVGVVDDAVVECEGAHAGLLAAALLLLLPRVSTDSAVDPVVRDRRWHALRDRPYLALTTANCLMSLQYFALAFAMPLWVIGHTTAPRWLISPMLLTNTIMIVVLQVRFSRGAKTPEGAAGSVLRAGAVLAASMVLYSAAAGQVEAVAVSLLIAAVVAHSFGELLQNAGAFGISYGLASQDALGEYLGVYGLGFRICRACAPGILAVTCLQHGTIGWIALASVFAMSGLATPGLVKTAQRSRACIVLPPLEVLPEVGVPLASSVRTDRGATPTEPS